MSDILSLHHVSKWQTAGYWGSRCVVDGHFRHHRSGFGPNGAGKSTLMKLATGQLRPELGKVLVCGKPAWSAAAKLQLGFCPENDVFYEEMTGRQFVERWRACVASANGSPSPG